MESRENEEIVECENSIANEIVMGVMKIAFVNQDFDMARGLINGNSCVKAKDEDGDTPLMYACEYGPTDIVKLLLDRGADVNGRGKHQESPLGKLLTHAKEVSDGIEEPRVFTIAKILLAAGADPNATDEEGLPVWWYYMVQTRGNPETVRLLFDHGYDINVQAFDDYSLTRMAVDRDNKPVLELCLQNGGNVNEICDDHGTLLHTLFQSDRSPDENKAFEILIFLLQCGFQHINQSCTGDFRTRGTVLFNAAKSPLPSRFIELLLEHGACADMGNPLNFLYLEKDDDAEYERDLEITRMLVKRGAQLDLETHFGALAFKRLLDPFDGGKVIEEKLNVAASILTCLFQENALRLPDEYGTEIEIGLSERWFKYPNLKYIAYLHQLGCKLKRVLDVQREFRSQCCLPLLAPDSLQMQCRARIRKMLGCPLCSKVDSLPLSNILKDFLSMKEVEEIKGGRGIWLKAIISLE